MTNKSLLCSKNLGFFLTILPFLYGLYYYIFNLMEVCLRITFLADESYPKISNWYGLLIISILSFITYKKFKTTPFLKKELLESIIAILYGLLIYLCFKNYLKFDPSYLFIGIFIIGIIYPIYRIHIYFGVILGMTYGFGAVLPAVMIVLAILLSWISHTLVKIVRERFSI
jgi:hypothetical protein